MTTEDVLDICGPDTYRVYALDEVGNVLDYVTTVEVGMQHRNAAPDPEPHAFAANRGHSNDLRYALEAITHMARTCADSLRAVTEAQADWVKTIAMAKGLPRNVAMPPPFVDHEDDEGNDEEQGPVAESTRTSGVEAALTMVAPYIPELMDSWRVKNGATSTNPRAHVNPMVHQRAGLRCADDDGLARHKGRRRRSGAPSNRKRPCNRRGEAAPAHNQEGGGHGKGVF